MQKNKILFLDRDGTIIVEPSDTFQVDSLEKLVFLPKVIRNLYKIIHELNYQLVLVTNQDGLGTLSFPEKDFWLVQNKMIELLANEGIEFLEICIDKSFEHENLPTRKPRIGMVAHYIEQKNKYDWENCYVIGDRLTDMELARNMNLKSIWISNDTTFSTLPTIAHTTTNWNNIYEYLAQQKDRTARIFRKTNETQIEVTLNLDTPNSVKIDTGVGFFNHMLEQIAKHAQISLGISTKGDLHIDEHHTIEDTAIALGKAFADALADKKGIARYGHFFLPMDEATAQIALDFSGRSCLIWKGDFKREKVGDFPTEMTKHFFQSFADNALCNLHIYFNGENDHHQIEAIFKAFAKAVNMAIQRVGTELLSTKGIL